MPEVRSLVINPSFRFSALDESGAPWDIIIASGIVRAENVILINSHASGGAQFFAMPSCIDGGGNTGWIFLESPDLETHAATLITTNSALANAEIINTAGVNATRRGFCFIEGSGTPTIADNPTYEDGSFAAGEYSLELPLSQSKTYTVRAYFVGGDGVVTYGNSVTVITYPEAPVGVLATPAETSIELSWGFVEGADSYNIYWGTSAGITEESAKFSGIFTNEFNHSSLPASRIFYYRISAMYKGLESALSAEVSSTTSEVVQLPDFSPQNWLETADYIKLLTSQYQLAENFKAWLRIHIDICKDGMVAANSLNNYFDVDFAYGAQLDIIGNLVGQKRVLPFQPTDGSEPTLDDEMYRTLIKARIAINHWDGKILSIEENWALIFPGTAITIVDNQDMTINVSVSGNISQLLQEMIEHDMIIPRPQGVMINYSWSPRVKKIFGWDYSESELEFGGWDIGYWSDDEEI